VLDKRIKALGDKFAVLGDRVKSQEGYVKLGFSTLIGGFVTLVVGRLAKLFGLLE